jgi:hypothetical protein
MIRRTRDAPQARDLAKRGIPSQMMGLRTETGR